ncbi:MAG TPA: glycosyltransferase family 39 protein [Gemmatimonadales bacterium]|nr:glycosyltransferase family 39 protein [Gemmatimonadales bacterium]
MRSLLLVIAIAVVLRVALACRQDLWADELFSVAVATGHSLEHPAADAVPALGDFVEPAGAVTPAHFRRYLEAEAPPAGPARVIRAVRLSDTSPPLYYLLLAGWTRLAGTGDPALHLFSVACALATLGVVWLLARRVGTARDALTAVLLFGIAPVSLYYAVEARMYALLWLASALTARLTLRLADRGDAGTLAAWTVVGAVGLLTHYFYVFVWSACLGWLLLRPGRVGRGRVMLAAAATLLLVAPWYRLVPETLARWRVTGHWLDDRPSLLRLVTAPLLLGWSYLSGRGVWGGDVWADRAAFAVVLAAGLWFLRRGRAVVLAEGRGLLWLWAVAAAVGPVVFDLLRGTGTSQIARYALAGMPAGFVLLALAIGALPGRGPWIAVGLLAAAWLPGLHEVWAHRTRAGEPYRAVARRVATWARPGDLVVIHAIPSGVLGVARYLDRDVPLAAWVGQLGRRRVPESLDTLLAGRARVAIVRIHEVGAPAPEEDWLRAHATLLGEEQRGSARLAYFSLVPTRR